MKTLNLTHPNKSDVQFKVSQFPDGQQDIIIEKYFDETDGESVWLEKIHKESIQIKSRFNSFKDLELIICATKALRRLRVKEIHLYIPYLLGARSDRQFVEGGTSYLVDTVAPVINSLGFESVTMMDVHSDVGMAVINNSKNETNVTLVKWALPIIDNTFEAQSKVALVSPDGGALKKIYETATGAKLTCDIIISAKHRDVVSGKLNGFDVPIKEHQLDKTLVWIDDICDGGGTFIGEAIKANEMGHRGKKYLIVTHGVLSKGFGELQQYFDGIFTTNSYADFNPDTQQFVKQLNII
jgi:ribose-phosphate pyrophosphokinase